MQIIRLWFEGFWYFLPALLANAAPGIAANKLHWWLMNRPVSEYWFGKNKTLGAYWLCPATALVTIYAQCIIGTVFPYFRQYELFPYDPWWLWLVGIAFGLGAICGDHIESAGKRQCGIDPGKPLFVFDQYDFMVGALLLATPLTGWLGWKRLGVLALFYVPWYLLGNLAGQKFGHRKTWL